MERTWAERHNKEPRPPGLGLGKLPGAGVVRRMDGRDLPPDVVELADNRDPLAILHRAVTGTTGAVPSPGPGTDRRHIPAAWGFLARAVEAYIADLSDEDLTRAVRDLSQSAGMPMAPACKLEQ